MKLNVGDILYCIRSISNISKETLYSIIQTRFEDGEEDICVNDDIGMNHWFGQVGSSECWTMWFITEKEWRRNNKIEEILN